MKVLGEKVAKWSTIWACHDAAVNARAVAALRQVRERKALPMRTTEVKTPT